MLLRDEDRALRIAEVFFAIVIFGGLVCVLAAFATGCVRQQEVQILTPTEVACAHGAADSIAECSTCTERYLTLVVYGMKHPECEDYQPDSQLMSMLLCQPPLPVADGQTNADGERAVTTPLSQKVAPMRR